jgi:choline-sulfatase
MGPEANRVETPSFNALAKRGLRFRQAYVTVPQTLGSHASMLSGLYPAGHGIHENGRYLSDKIPLVPERLRGAGYNTAAFVSAFALARRFGLARGFDVYDEDFGNGELERTAKETTDRVLTYLAQEPRRPLFLWVHYYDPHYPYTPPEPFLSRYAKQPYFGEVAFMDEQLGRLVQAFEQRIPGPLAVIIAGDHGEGLGDHGEETHGDLLYQATMRVPLLLIGPGFTPGVSDSPVSTRRIFHTILDLAGLGTASSLRRADHEVLVGEAMKPFLDYGWQPQVMAVEGHLKTISAGKVEIYDVIADPGETRDLAGTIDLSRSVRQAIREYPIPAVDAPPPKNISDDDRRKLAALGYIASEVKPVVRKDAPRPADMIALIPMIERSMALFVREQYAADIPLLQKILARDPHNLDAALHLAVSYSQLGDDARALGAFKRAEAIAPDSADVRTYLALHYARGKEWQLAVPLLERVVSESPDRLPALEGLAVIRQRQGRLDEAIRIRQTIYTKRTPSPAELVQFSQLSMAAGQTAVAIDALEQVRKAEGAAFRHDLELGALYLAVGRLQDARDALDRVPPSDPRYPMALFKRAQVSVLLHELDQSARIDSARQHADATTRELIARERLFR